MGDETQDAIGKRGLEAFNKGYRLSSERSDRESLENALDCLGTAAQCLNAARPEPWPDARYDDACRACASLVARVEEALRSLANSDEGRSRKRARRASGGAPGPSALPDGRLGLGSAAASVPSVSETGGDPADEPTLDAKVKQALASCFPQSPAVAWSQVGGAKSTKLALYNAVILPKRQPQLFKRTTPCNSALLFGPPGTGKTLLAQALATECGYKFMVVDPSVLHGEYQGESERRAKLLFDVAKQNAPVVVFFDEIDAIAGRRSTGDGAVAANIKATLLQGMDGFSSSLGDGSVSERVFVMGATNRPDQIDDAFRRRFKKRIYVGLPDADARKEILIIHMTKAGFKAEDEQLATLTERTQEFSGADIKELVVDACHMPFGEVNVASYFRPVAPALSRAGPGVRNEPTLWMACKEGDQGAVRKRLHEVEDERLQVRPVQFRDFEEALLTRKPSVSRDDLTTLEKFASEFGEDGK